MWEMHIEVPPCLEGFGPNLQYQESIQPAGLVHEAEEIYPTPLQPHITAPEGLGSMK